MDRIELGTQSLEEYRGFAGDGDSIEGTDNTKDLVDKLKSDDKGLTLIVSSIQKMGLVYGASPAKKEVLPRMNLIESGQNASSLSLTNVIAPHLARHWQVSRTIFPAHSISVSPVLR